ncbi:MAG: response regulator transcription factor [Verrucomicrobiota bacterium]
MSNIRVILADDHALVRAGIRSLLEKIPGVEVLGEANDGREAIELVTNLAPDAVLMDIAMSGLNGLEATARLTKEFPRIKVIMLSMHDNEHYVVQALRAGATGYLLKGAGAKELEQALKTVVNGATYLSPAISRNAVERLMEQPPEKSLSLDQLTPRQREILQLIAEGKSTKEIAGILKISAKTVETHRGHLMTRLGIYDVAGLVRYAIRTGLIETPT